jgi:glycosyltransferase involved in cell wall biosynthesis
MRVAFVVGTCGGGTGRHVQMLASGFPARGVPVAVFGPASAGRDFGFPSFTAVEIADRPRLRDAVTVWRLRRWLRSGFPVVHAHGLRAGALTALCLLGLQRRPRLVVTVHNAPVAGGFIGAVYRVLEFVVARRADLVLCVSADLEVRMRAARARQVGHAVISAPYPDAVPVSVAVSVPASVPVSVPAGSSVSGPYVLGLGRLAPQKGFGTLIEAAARWGNGARLMIAGKGPLDASLKAQAASLGVDVDFAGLRSDVPALLAGAAVFALSSQWEGQSLALMEALRAGVPIVATKSGGNPAVAGEDAALFVPPGDADAFAEAVRRILDDPGLAERLRKAALDRARDLPTEEDTLTAAQASYR